MRILVADDNRFVRRGILGLLAEEPLWEVCAEASDGSEVIQKVAESCPDLVLLDVSMPGSNGLDVARALRKQFPALKLIILSQHDPQQLRPRALAAGADACVDKARIGTDLLATIRATAGS